VFDIGRCVDDLRKLVPPKFHVSSHVVTLFGVCAACRSSFS
jgi:Fe2+ or Zn2+ uptake regulation protein